MARYKAKKQTEDGNTVYEYSERQVALRNSEKAKRIEALRGRIGDLRKQVKKDLRSSDPDRFLTALAVGLIDATYERVGNDESAGEGHFGVTGWQRKHISFGRKNVTISYVGKSGVKQKKSVSDAMLVKALRDAYEAVEGDDACVFSHDLGAVTAEKVNAYLRKFKVTAKDLRGLHANEEMRRQLKAVRKGALPTDPKERKAQLKEEWKKALEATAEAVGHEASTLRSQYLVPGMEDKFLASGTVLEKLDKSAAHRLVDRFLATRYAADKPPSKAQIDYVKHLLKLVGGEEPDWDKVTRGEMSDLIDGLRKKRGRPTWYGNGQFAGWEKY